MSEMGYTRRTRLEVARACDVCQSVPAMQTPRLALMRMSNQRVVYARVLVLETVRAALSPSSPTWTLQGAGVLGQNGVNVG